MNCGSRSAPSCQAFLCILSSVGHCLWAQHTRYLASHDFHVFDPVAKNVVSLQGSAKRGPAEVQGAEIGQAGGASSPETRGKRCGEDSACTTVLDRTVARFLGPCCERLARPLLCGRSAEATRSVGPCPARLVPAASTRSTLQADLHFTRHGDLVETSQSSNPAGQARGGGGLAAGADGDEADAAAGGGCCGRPRLRHPQNRRVSH